MVETAQQEFPARPPVLAARAVVVPVRPRVVAARADGGGVGVGPDVPDVPGGGAGTGRYGRRSAERLPRRRRGGVVVTGA